MKSTFKKAFGLPVGFAAGIIVADIILRGYKKLGDGTVKVEIKKDESKATETEESTEE